MKLKLMLIVLCVMSALVSAVNFAGAQAAIWTTSDAAGNNREQTFVVGQTIYIWWNPQEPQTIKIYDPEGHLVADLGVQSSQPATWVPQEVGEYWIVIPGTGWIGVKAVVTVLVIPESILGTLMATVLGFAAFGVFRFSRSKRLNR